ncbi:MAG: hypothetical protein IH594_18270 [Bacteroidales bacterium]|nr:hypothetical protein [Bacteroidales bacterium]
MIPENLIRIGVLTRPHGIDGTMILRISDNFVGELTEGEFLFLSIDRTMIPFFIEDLRLAGDTAYICFSEIVSGEQTEFLRGRDAYISSGSDDITGNYESFTGFIIKDETSGREGEISAFYDNGDNPLFLMVSEGNEYLVPANPALIHTMNKKRRLLIMKLPQGIFDLGD